jgi:hypothetical protein
MAVAASNRPIHRSPARGCGSVAKLIANASPTAKANIAKLAQPSRMKNPGRLERPSAEHPSTPNSRNMRALPSDHESAVAIAPRKLDQREPDHKRVAMSQGQTWL